MDVFSGNAIKDGRKVGRGGGTCQAIHVDGEKVTTQCLLTMQLESGSVTMQALWVRGSSPLDMAITGGTGSYLDAEAMFASGTSGHRTKECAPKLSVDGS
ncbi:hypothetical protein [Nocardia sp. CS682]|uniref:allene oxide cyclase barrel-like domain-containing protein n=1 Tax=Nocardia sp. CS682 TaxID=1047172 RepID=UPI001074A3A3|nr:hypothetical protein [Nocardia sp. CS682]QBS45113.1 hypothetical protein DMB37_38560 [Nocardia sp. CS682]